MKTHLLRTTSTVALVVSIFNSSLSHAAGDGNNGVSGKIGGKIYTDWSIALEQSETEAGEDTTLVSHGFANHRAYFGYKMTIVNRFIGCVMLDVGRVDEVTDLETSVDETSGNISAISTSHDHRLEAYAKYAYLEMKEVLPRTSMTLGLRGRRQFKLQEKFWGYRYVYKSFMDANKYGSSADLGFGIAVEPFDQLSVYLDVDNGEGYKKLQMDDNYKGSLGIQAKPTGILDLYAYVDAMPVDKNDQAIQYTVAGFAGIRPVDAFRLGLEYDYQANTKGVEGSALNGISVFGIVVPWKVLEIFARFDMLSTDDYETTSKLAIGGVQIAPHGQFKIAPNVQVSIPEGDDLKPTTRIAASAMFKF
ncbi:MAG: hypothetical protein GF418_00700 [Chitinivibrionales bacterium]|nr:hypothetical protein [Chitinivibrionales bacterium]MBD3394119.1 hypothetical protein [Chitinivibrionales bacterium]